MDYTQEQKDTLYRALLPNIHAEGGVLAVDKMDQIQTLANYHEGIIIPIELLDPSRDNELRKRLTRHFYEHQFDDNYVVRIKALLESNSPQARELLRQATEYIFIREHRWDIEQREWDQSEGIPPMAKHAISLGYQQNYSLEDMKTIMSTQTHLMEHFRSGHPYLHRKTGIHVTKSTLPEYTAMFEVIAKTDLGKDLQKKYQQEFISDMISRLRDEAKVMAKKYDHPKTPYMQTRDMALQRDHVAKTLAYSCTEEAEMLHYQQRDRPGIWPVLLLTDPMPYAGVKSGKASGMMDPTDKVLRVCNDKTSHYTFSNTLQQDRTLYEEVIHFADYVIGRDYLKLGLNLSYSVLHKPSVTSILDGKSRGRCEAPSGVPQNKWVEAHEAKAKRTLKNALHGHTPDEVKEIDKLLKIVSEEAKIPGYLSARENFFGRGDGTSASTEIMAKTYANILTCRDQLEKKKHPPALDKLVKYLAYRRPEQGGVVFTYTQTRDEYLNHLRQDDPSLAIAFLQPRSTYWKDNVVEIKDRGIAASLN